MEISKTLRRPSNWPDFETLCKKLWGEIWSCPEIKKNGRAGQIQNGVDIYGIPFNENEYYGIQCKGKDEYTNKQLTEGEITSEIEKAKLFQPPLKKLYFATTAIKDAVIEEFIRKKNLENRANGLFEIHIFSWEDIVELIDENKQTSDYYLKSQNYKSSKSVSITFQNGQTEMTVNPKFRKKITFFKQKIIPAQSIYNVPNPLASTAFGAIFQQSEHLARLTPIIVRTELAKVSINQSLCKIYFQIHNTGIEPLEEYKMFFAIKGEIQEITDDNELREGTFIMPIMRRIPNISLFQDTMTGTVTPLKTILVGDDSFNSDKFYIKPFPKNYEIIVSWKLISKDFKDEGELKILVDSDIEIEYKNILIEDPLKVRTVESEIEDLLVEKKNK
jgi:hypothetical protein